MSIFSMRHRRLGLVSIFVLLTVALSVLLSAGAAHAAPVLNVSKPSGKVLLGENAVATITVTNSGDARGYNLSLTDTFNSVPAGTGGKSKIIEFVSASGPDGPLSPTSVSTDSNNYLTVSFDDIRDLVPTESCTISIVVRLLDTNGAWVVGDEVHDSATAKVNTVPDGSGTWIEGSATGDIELIPIKMVTKSANQSTANHQATGCGELPGHGGKWPYTYTVTVQNNLVNPTNSVVVNDSLPDGIEYLGMVAGAPPDAPPVHDPVSGATAMTWTIGDMAPAQTWTVTYSAGIRYDYYGTANGGTNRPYDDYDGMPPLGAPVPDGTGLQNTANLTGSYQGTPVTDNDSASVTAAYATISKGAAPGTAGNGDTVTFTFTWTTSEYYNIDTVKIVDVVPDGLTYTGVASIAPDIVEPNTPGAGQTRLTWDGSAPGSTFPTTLAAGSNLTITFQATVDDTWQAPPHAGEWIVAGDSMSNHVTLDAEWNDEIDPPRAGTLTAKSASAGVTLGPNPSITKEVARDNGGVPGAYGDTAEATVGDTLWFRVRFNTSDGANPITSNVQYGLVDVVDWIPRWTQFVPASATMAYSDAGDFFHDPPPVKYTSYYNSQPQHVSSGTLDGYAWSLGNVDEGGWWQTEFRVVVQDDPSVVGGVVVKDYGKLSWQNTAGMQFSGRDIADITYRLPNLTITKTRQSTSTPLGAGSDVNFRMVVTNTATASGTITANNVLVYDTLPSGMRNYDPTTGVITVYRGAALLTQGVDYNVTYVPGTGVLTFDFDDLGVNTPLPAPPAADNFFQINYTARVDANVGAGRTLTNTGRATWSCQRGGTSPNRNFGPVSSATTLTLPSLTIAKTIVSPGSGIVAIGETLTYRLTVTVPANNVAYMLDSRYLYETISRDGLEYVTSTTLLTDVSGTPVTPARFTGGSTNADPAINWTSPNPGCTLTWGMDTPIDNRGQAVAYVWQVEFQVKATGLVTPQSQGGDPNNPANWNWWPGQPVYNNPTIDNTATDRGYIYWQDLPAGGTARNAQSGQPTTTIRQPYLVLTKTNDHEPPIQTNPGDLVNYTVNIVNNGRSTSYRNIVVDTLPEGMRAAPPTVTGVTLNGVPLVEGTGYVYSWAPATGEQTFDLYNCPSPSNIPSTQTLVITYRATVDDDVGSGLTLTNVSYSTYNPQSSDPGRQVDDGDDPAGGNEDDSQIMVRNATLTKTNNAPGGVATVGQEYDYSISTTVPAHTVLYNSFITDIIPRGLQVIGTPQRQLDGIDIPPPDIGDVPTVGAYIPLVGTPVRWDIHDYTNDTDNPQTLGLIVHVRVRNEAYVTGFPPQTTFSNTATVEWDDKDTGGTHHTASNSPPDVVTAVEPRLDMTKTNDKSGIPVDGTDTITYTLSMTNSGTSTSYQNLVVDTLPVGLRGTTPTVTDVYIGATHYTEGDGYTVDWTSPELTVDMAGGTTPTNLPAGQTLVVVYQTHIDATGLTGAGSTLTNIASVGYNSWTDANGRETAPTLDPADRNTDDSSVTVKDATVAKTQNTVGNESAIGQPFTYTVAVTVPAGTSIYDSSVVDDVPANLHVTGLDASYGSADQAPGPGGTTRVTWTIDDYTNATGSPATITLDIDVYITTGATGLPPRSTFSNEADLTWYETAGHTGEHTDDATAATVTAAEPHLVLTEVNDAGPTVVGNEPVHYTIQVVNDGTSTAYQNVLVQTFPEGMRGNTPTVTSVAIAGVPLVEGVDYTVDWNASTGELTVDLTAGSGGAKNIEVGLLNRLLIDVTHSASEDAGAGATLTDITSIGYNSWTDANGRETPRTPLPADNTDYSTIRMANAAFQKTQNAAGNITTIGNSYVYSLTITVPARTSLYNAVVTDTFPDGLTVTGTDPDVGSAPFVENPATGEWDVTWTLPDPYTNSTDAPVDLVCDVTVRVDRKYSDDTDVKAGDVFPNSADLDWDDWSAVPPGDHHTLTDSATDVAVQEPDLAVDKSVDDPTPEAGDTVTYTIEVTNNGLWPAYNVELQDTVDPRLTYVPPSITGPGANDSAAPYLTWDITGVSGLNRPINAGETVTLGFKATVNGGIAMGTVVPNTATIPTYDGGQPPAYGRTYGPAGDTQNVTARAAELGLLKEVTVNPNPDWGEQVTYRITVTNSGDAAARSVDISDTLPTDIFPPAPPPHFTYVAGTTSATWPGGSSTADPTGTAPDYAWGLDATLNPTEQLVLTFNMSVDQWANYGTKTNTGYADGLDGAGTALPQASGTADIDVKQHPAITLGKALDDPDRYVPVGNEFTYTITVTDAGNTVVPVVPLDDTYDQAYMEFVGATIAPTTADPGHLTWADISGGAGIIPTQTASVTVTFRALQPGATPNTDDTAACDTVDDHSNPVSATDTNDELIITQPGLSVTKTLDEADGIVPVGDEFTYTVRLENTGDTDIVVPVALQDNYDPAYMTFKSAAPAPTTAAAGNLTWADATVGAGIPVGGHVDVKLTFVAKAVGETPKTDDRVDASALDEHGDPVSDDDTNTALTITNPQVTVSKGLAPGQKASINVGDEVTFRVVVKNTGNTRIKAPVKLSDTYNKRYLGFVEANPDPDSSRDDGRLDWSDLTEGSTLMPGARVVVDITFEAKKEGQPPNTGDTAATPRLTDVNGDPVEPSEDTDSVVVGTGKVRGATEWFLAEGSTGGGFDTWILLMNPGDTEANVDVTFTTASGPREPVKVTMEPASRMNIRVSDYVPDDFHVSTIVKSDALVVAERSMYWDRRYWGETNVPGDPQPYEMKGGHATLGIPVSKPAPPTDSGASKVIYFPEGATGGGFDTWILLCNTTGKDASVKATFMDACEPVATADVTVPAMSRQTIHVDQYVPNSLEVSTRVDSDVPIIGERSMYWDPNGENLQPYEMKGGHSSPGLTKVMKEWYVAEGSTGQGFETFILIANPGQKSAKVTVDFINASGVAATKELKMAKCSRATVKVGDYVPNDFHVSSEVRATEPIAVERSQYWDKRVTPVVRDMRGGHSNCGSTIKGKTWMVPEGSTAQGFDTWILLANPTTREVTAKLTFMTEAGPREPVEVKVPASTRNTIRISDYVPDDFYTATFIEADGEIAVERAMYWDKRESSGIQPYEMMGGHSASGVDP